MDPGSTAESAFFGFDNKSSDGQTPLDQTFGDPILQDEDFYNQIFNELITGGDTSDRSSQGNGQRPSISCCFVKGLFGPSTPAVPIHGSIAALGELIVAVNRDHLFIQNIKAHPSDCFPIAYQHLEMEGVFPDEKELRAIQDLTMDDASTPLRQADRTNVTPAFKTLDVEGYLCVLADTAMRYKIYTNAVLGHPQSPVYQVGVITMLLDENGNPSFQAQLFSTQDNADATATLWLYRWCVADGQGGYDEHWRALGDGTFDTSTLKPQDSQLSSSKPATPANKGKKRARRVSDVGGQDVDIKGFPTPNSLPHQNKSACLDDRLAGDEPEDHLFIESPDAISGSAILRLARFYSNQELFRKINAGLEAKGLPPLKEENVITRRITVAIQSQASKSEDTAQEIRAELDAARQANGVAARMKMKTKAVREAKKAAKLR